MTIVTYFIVLKPCNCETVGTELDLKMWHQSAGNSSLEF